MNHSSVGFLSLMLVGATSVFAIEPSPSSETATSIVRYSEIARKVVNLGDHTATFVKVRPPVLPKAPPPPLPKQLTEAERERIAELENKAHASLNITATVFLGGKQPVTELRWRDQESGNLEHVAYSNADFRYLSQLQFLETRTTIYQWFPFVDAYQLSEWTADAKSPIPANLDLDPAEIEYLVGEQVKAGPDQEVTLAGLDYLHAFYRLHYVELKNAFEKRTAEEAERERELKENPPKPANVIIRFWPKTFPKN